MRRTGGLRLAKETLTELTGDQLFAVGAASGLPCQPIATVTTVRDSEVPTCASILQPCISWTLCTTRPIRDLTEMAITSPC